MNSMADDSTTAKKARFFSSKVLPKEAYIGLSLSSFFINLLGLALPIALLQVYDRIIPNEALNTLLLLILGVITALILESILRYSRSYISCWFDAKFEFSSGCEAFKRFLSTKIQDVERDGAGAHLEKMNAINTLKDFYGGQAAIALFDIPFVVLFLALIAIIAGKLVFVPMVILLALATFTITMGKRMRRTLDERRTADDRRLNFIIELLTGIHTIKSMAMEAQMMRRYERLQQTSAIGDYQMGVEGALSFSTISFISQLTMVLIVIAGSILVIQNSLTIGGLAACTLLAGRTIQPVTRLMQVWTRWQAIKVAEKRFATIADLPSESAELVDPIAEIKGNIRFKDVTLCVKDGHPPILDKVNLTINAGDCVAIKGNSLSGKSTLLWMILGLNDPSDGDIIIDGHNLKDINHQELRQYIAYLPQHAELFEGTILENLTQFRVEQYAEKAYQYAARLGLDEIIDQLPQGYQTRTGQAGSDILPRGVKQRIAIVRALIDDPKIILFDEADSAVDLQADKLIRNLLVDIKKHCTVIIVSHRPSNLKLADRTYVIENGRLQPAATK